MLDRNEHVSSIVQQGFRTLIGNGINIDFWDDDQTRLGSFEVMFPRIFTYFVLKHGLVNHFEGWDRGSWHLNVELRR